MKRVPSIEAFLVGFLVVAFAITLTLTELLLQYHMPVLKKQDRITQSE